MASICPGDIWVSRHAAMLTKNKFDIFYDKSFDESRHDCGMDR